MQKPPKTYRYCGQCNYITVFEYNPTVMHSACTNCGWRLVPTIKTDWKTFKKLHDEAWEKFELYEKRLFMQEGQQLEKHKYE